MTSASKSASLQGRLSLDATWFRNRYKDLIVSLGGSLSNISQYQTDNVANSLAEGVETSARFRPANWISVTGNYMWLESAVLSLNGGSGLVQQYFYLGQPLLRRPKQSGSAVVNFQYGRIERECDGLFPRARSGRGTELWRVGGSLPERGLCEHRGQRELPRARQSYGLCQSAQRARPAL